MTRLYEYILAQDDPHAYIYEALCGAYGVEIRDTITELYNDISVDDALHPDDDFDKIIDRMVQYMEIA